jgi:phosphatidylglycerophosphate synthase
MLGLLTKISIWLLICVFLTAFYLGSRMKEYELERQMLVKEDRLTPWVLGIASIAGFGIGLKWVSIAAGVLIVVVVICSFILGSIARESWNSSQA